MRRRSDAQTQHGLKRGRRSPNLRPRATAGNDHDVCGNILKEVRDTVYGVTGPAYRVCGAATLHRYDTTSRGVQSLPLAAPALLRRAHGQTFGIRHTAGTGSTSGRKRQGVGRGLEWRS